MSIPWPDQVAVENGLKAICNRQSRYPRARLGAPGCRHRPARLACCPSCPSGQPLLWRFAGPASRHASHRSDPAVTFFDFDEVDRHRCRNDRRAIARDIGNCPEQRALVFLGCALMKLADAHGLAIGLRKDRPVALGEGLEHPCPGRDPRNAGSHRQAGLGLDLRIDEPERGQRLCHRIAVKPAAQHRLAHGRAVEREPALVAVFQPLGPVLPFRRIPDDFGEARLCQWRRGYRRSRRPARRASATRAPYRRGARLRHHRWQLPP